MRLRCELPLIDFKINSFNPQFEKQYSSRLLRASLNNSIASNNAIRNPSSILEFAEDESEVNSPIKIEVQELDLMPVLVKSLEPHHNAKSKRKLRNYSTINQSVDYVNQTKKF